MILDVMPTDQRILGFGNCWYKAAIRHAERIKLAEERAINVVSVPYFLATKLEAFRSRGKSDFLGSHDLEDVLSVFDGCQVVVNAVERSDKAIKAYLAQQCRILLSDAYFHDALAGHLNYGAVLEDRVNIVLERMEKISNINGLK